MDLYLPNLQDELSACRTFARLVCRDEKCQELLLERTFTEAIRLAGDGKDEPCLLNWLLRLICHFSREKDLLAADEAVAPRADDPLVRALHNLPWREREAIILTDLLGIEPEDAAMIIGCDESTVWACRTTARLTLSSTWPKIVRPPLGTTVQQRG